MAAAGAAVQAEATMASLAPTPSTARTAAPSRVLMCFWDGYLSSAPSVVNGLRHLVQRGHVVDLLMRDTAEPWAPRPSLPPGVRITAVPAPASERRRRHVAEGHNGSRVDKVLATFRLVRDLHAFLAAARALAARSGRYDIVIGVDPCGLVAAEVAMRASPAARLVYWSLELYLSAYIVNPVMQWVKRREARISRGADLVLIQDMDRARSLADDNGFSLERVACVPNSPMGGPERGAPGFLQQRLAVPPEQRIALYAGTIGDDMRSMDLARAAATWPEPYRLVFHTYRKRDAREPYIRAVHEASGRRALLSLDPVSLDHVDDVFGSAWVGLAFYQDLGPNYTQIFAASGKLAYCLRNGVPIVVNALPSLKVMVEKTGCGVAVADLADLPAAFAAIDADYAGFQARALACYREHFDFQPYFDAALDRLPRVR